MFDTGGCQEYCRSDTVESLGYGWIYSHKVGITRIRVKLLGYEWNYSDMSVIGQIWLIVLYGAMVYRNKRFHFCQWQDRPLFSEIKIPNLLSRVISPIQPSIKVIKVSFTMIMFHHANGVWPQTQSDTVYNQLKSKFWTKHFRRKEIAKKQSGLPAASWATETEKSYIGLKK